MKKDTAKIFLTLPVILFASAFITWDSFSATPYGVQQCRGPGANCGGYTTESACTADSQCTWCDCDWVNQGYDTCGSDNCASGTNTCGNSLRDPDCSSATLCSNWQCTWSGRNMCDCEGITAGGPNSWNPVREHNQGDGGCSYDEWCCDQHSDACWKTCGTVCRTPVNQGCDCSSQGSWICCNGACCGGICVTAQCSSGPCCTTGTYSGCYASSSTVCNTWDEYRCIGGDANGCGATLEKRTNNRYCTGNTNQCTGSVTYGSWSTSQTCAATEVCDSGVPECRSDPVLCPLDTTPPTTTITPNGVPWNNDDVVFTLICTDSGSGCDTSHYKIIDDGQACGTTGFTQGTSGTVTCQADQICNKRVCFYSVDKDGNQEPVKQSNVFTIDKTNQDTGCYYKSIYEFDGEYSGYWAKSACLRPGWGGQFEVSGGTVHGVTSGRSNNGECDLGGLRYYIWTDTDSGGPCWHDLWPHDKFNAANYPVVTIRGRHENGSTQDVWIFWQIDGDWGGGVCGPSTGGLECKAYIGGIPDDGNWHVLEKDLSGVSGWDGQDICNMRLDVANSPWAHYEFDYLRVSNNGYDCGGGDGCYPYQDGCEERDYYCSDGSCLNTVSNRNTDYYDSYENYCSGNQVRRHRRFHDYYCDGESCTDHTTWVDDQLVEDCNIYDTCSGSCPGCTYQDYSCSGGACVSADENPDDNSAYCSSCLGSGYWNLGGDDCNPQASGLQTSCCCGDDLNENVAERQCDGYACTNDPSDKACCDQTSDCVWNNVCYNDGDGHPSLAATCNNGIWEANPCMGKQCGEPCLFISGICDGPDGNCYSGGGCLLDCSPPSVTPPDQRIWANQNCGRTGSYKCGPTSVCSNSYTSCTTGGTSTQVTGSWSSYTPPTGTYYPGQTMHITLNGVSNSPSAFTILTECRIVKPDGSSIYFDNWGSGNVDFSYQIQPTDPLGVWTLDYCGLWSDFELNSGWSLRFDNTDYTFDVNQSQLTVTVTGAPPNWQNIDATANVSCVGSLDCDSSSYRMLTYDSDPGTCPSDYSSYTLPSPQAIPSHQWVCGAAKDIAGSEGFSNPTEFKVDKIKPTVSVDGSAPNWQNTNADASVKCSDTGGSSCDTSSYLLLAYDSDPGTCPSDYSSYTLPSPQAIPSHQWVCGAAKDIAGSEGFSNPTEFKVDTTPPSSKLKMLSTYTSQTSFNLTWNGTDDESGIDCYVIQYKYQPPNQPETSIKNITFPDGECTTQTQAIFDAELATGIPDLDGYTFYFRSLAKDNAGNQETKNVFDTYTKIFMAMVKFEIDETFQVTMARTEIIKILVSNSQLIADTIHLSLNSPHVTFLDTGTQTMDLDMNPHEVRALKAVVYPASLGTFNLTATATSNVNPSLTGSDWLEVTVVTPPEFPGLNWIAICLLLTISALIYLKFIQGEE